MRRTTPDRVPMLAELTPSRWDDDPVGRARAAVAGLVGVTGAALEWSATGGRVRFFVRAATPGAMERALAQLRAQHPQAAIRPLDVAARPDLDPLHTTPDERILARELRLERPSALPLAGVPADRGRRPDRGDDPLAGVLGAAAGVGPGQRLVGQIVLGPATGGWGQRLAARAMPDRSTSMPYSPRASSTELLPLVVLAALGGLALRAYLWFVKGQFLPIVLLGIGLLVGLPLIAALAARFIRRDRVAPELVREKLRAPILAAHIRLFACGRGDALSLDLQLERVAAATRAFDHPAGNGLHARPWRGDARRLQIPVGPFRRPDLLSAAEIAALWHLPNLPLPSLSYGRSRHLLPAPGTFERGCRIGVFRHQGAERSVHLPPSLLRRNHLVVAKTRRGKSTLMLHVARHLMDRMAAGGVKLALAVIDPHQDLAEAVLGSVPAGLEERVVYLNLADGERPVGINLLDTDLFPGRDRTAENVVTMLHRLWPDNWGPRMEGALRAAITSLHEANQVRPPGARYTLLDVTPMLSSPAFRGEVMAQVRDLALHAWWAENYDRLARAFQQQIANPVTTKIGRFLVGEPSRFALGQPRSTFDPRALLRDGGVLVVNAAVGRLGEGAAGLLGATVLNLLALVVEEQVSVPPDRRARLVTLIDESSVLGAADYPRMLGELNKYGASFMLVTQSLARLDAIDRQLRPTIFANIDGLTVFQVSAEDAEDLVPELGPELAEEDLTDLDDHACYARWWADGRRPAAFSLQVDPPPAFDAVRVQAIARRSAERYGRPREDVAREIEAVLRLRGERRPQPSGESGRAAAGPMPNWSEVTEEGAEAVQLAFGSMPTAQMNMPPPAPGRRSHARSNAAKRR